MYQSTISLGAYHTGILLEDGTVRLFGANDFGQSTLPGLQGRKVKGLALGRFHTGILLEDGTVRLFGANDFGQSTLPGLQGRKVKGLALGADHTGLLLEDGTVRLFGANDFGQSTLPDLPGLKVASDVVPLSSQLDKQADEADQRKKTVFRHLYYCHQLNYSTARGIRGVPFFTICLL
jgi:alpha-tubulin suppressor-like RCC1 family protein